MIQLHCIKGTAFIFDIQDWKTLRTDYRIIGDVIGSNDQSLPALPVALLPEEVWLLVEKNVVVLVEYQLLHDVNVSDDEKLYKSLSKDLLKEEQNVYFETRKEQVLHFKDKIISAKRQKGDLRAEEEILQEEYAKVQVDENNMLWPIFVAHLRARKGEAIVIDPTSIFANTTTIRCKVYTDLWLKGYYITLGHKFGGDFLVYQGDPVLYHATFIVHCLEDAREKEFHPSEIVAYGRLGNSVKKNIIIAGEDLNNKLFYITLNWLDI